MKHYDVQLRIQCKWL